MRDYLTEDKLFDILKETLLEYQLKHPGQDDLNERFCLEVEPLDMCFLSAENFISKFREYAKWHSLNPFRFIIKDQETKRDIFRILQNKTKAGTWEIREIT